MALKGIFRGMHFRGFLHRNVNAMKYVRKSDFLPRTRICFRNSQSWCLHGQAPCQQGAPCCPCAPRTQRVSGAASPVWLWRRSPGVIDARLLGSLKNFSKVGCSLATGRGRREPH